MEKELRVASLLSSATEILYQLGLGDAMVAVSHECDYPTAVSQLPRVTGSNIDSSKSSLAIDQEVKTKLSASDALYSIDLDLLQRLQPNLIITQAQCDVCAVKYEDVVKAVQSLPHLQDTKIVALNPMGLEDIFQDIHTIAQATGREQIATEYVLSLQQRVSGIKEKTALLSSNQRPRVAMIEWIDPIMLAANWVPELLEIAGGKCELTQAGRHSEYLNWDQLAQYDPQVIVLMPCGFDLKRTMLESATLTSNPSWANLSAVKNSKVFATDANSYFNRSGPRVVESLEMLSHFLHPELFDRPNLPEDSWSHF